MITETRSHFIERFASRYPEDEQPMVRGVIRAAALAVLGADADGPMHLEEHLRMIGGLQEVCETFRVEAAGAGR